MKITGKIQRLDLGAGGWLLVADDGRKFQVQHSGLKDGARVEIDGEVEQGGVSFAMTAPILKVRSVRELG